MDGIGDNAFDSHDLDPDAALWVRGADYLAGWRDATQAATELSNALTAVGIETTGSKLRATASADGSALVKLELSAATVREIATITRRAGAQERKAG
ncbi:hypothetical protein OH809_16480 [Streptomyces sp. NBC_00873]|uniref:hypothetical protein n=1 Tax=unclassified Streptomyces TaxID=2593676 RepID=UPI0038666252|nr:hypothetical protein OH809_16480 [Streptomyces sp. NBC_00873]WTA45856.1 hypothetical protein OH821_27205 [Streptomyces sp. NBC_00842]